MKKRYINALVVFLGMVFLIAFSVNTNVRYRTEQVVYADFGIGILYELAETVQPQTDTECRSEMEIYQEFLASDEMYELTKTVRYPRGDSHAVYAFSDCDGDGQMELHVDSAESYRIYTVREGELVLLKEFEHGWPYPNIVPLEDGSFVGAGIMEENRNRGMSVERRLPLEGDKKESTYEGEVYYAQFRIDAEGKVTEGTRYHSQEMFVLEELLAQLPLQSDALEWHPVFSEEEWAYLDALEEGDGAPGDGSEEWEAYERILSGDFSDIAIDERNALRSVFEKGLDWKTGRSRSRYLVRDFNGDGVSELFVLYEPEEKEFSHLLGWDSFVSGTACFTYRDGKVSMLWVDTIGYHDYYVPLSDDRFVLMNDYAYLPMFSLAVMDEMCRFSDSEQRITYKNLIVDYSLWDESTYEHLLEDYGVSGEGSYYFEERWNGEWERRQMTEDEWNELEETLKELTIPEEEWMPASVFMPERYYVEVVGVG